MKKIKLMADYFCHPLWDMSSGGYRDIDPCELPISKELQLRLSKWAAMYDATLDHDDPPNSGFKSKELENEFKEEERRIFNMLEDELSPKFTIYTQSN